MSRNARQIITVVALFAACVLAPIVCSADTCTALLSFSLSDTQITSATVVAAAGAVPEYCRVRGTITSTVGFEVRMPTVDWNIKLMFFGNAGYAGRIPTAAQNIGLSLGYATAATDTGHTSPNKNDATWALNNRQGEIDFGYRAVHVSTLAAQSIIAAFYGASPSFSYFYGCSTGGRQALEEAQRFPNDYNGIIACAPALDTTGSTIGFTWNMQALLLPLGAALPASKLPMIGATVVNACDAIDGLVDGLIDDPRKCDFDPVVLQCTGDDAPDCLTAPQVQALRQVYAGPTTSDGKQLQPGFPPGGEGPASSRISNPQMFGINGNSIGWEQDIAGTLASPPIQFILQDGYLRYLGFEVDDPSFDWSTFNFDVDPARLEFMGEIFNATNLDLSAFAANGGKLLIYHGWSDGLISPLRVIEYYKAIQRGLGRKATEQFARLFMAPGMFHGNGGPGPNSFSAITVLENWVERGQPPDSIVASHADGQGVIDRTRPLCPYPQVARYIGTGSIDAAENFRCVGPPPE
jgi:feruloyl esterase